MALTARLDQVARTWTPQQRLHVGNVAWAHARGDGSPAPDTTLSWAGGFADVWFGDPATVSLHVTAGVEAAVDEILQAVPHLTVEISLQQYDLVRALTDRGLQRAAGPWFVQLWRSLADLPAVAVPAGYTVRAVRRDELADRVEVHRRCWDPARIKRLLDLPITGDERGSGYSVEKHLAVIGTPPYRPELDLVAEAPDGSLAAFALGWLDPRSGSVLFEPVGTTPEHARRGLARALCAEMLHVARDLGAVQAVVGPRGDGGYPVPRRLYEGLGMREAGQVVPFTTGSSARPPPVRHPPV